MAAEILLKVVQQAEPVSAATAARSTTDANATKYSSSGKQVGEDSDPGAASEENQESVWYVRGGAGERRQSRNAMWI